MAQRRTILVVLIIATAALMALSLTRTSPASLRINTDQNGLAIKGYDTVAYFIHASPMKGNEKFSTRWKGATWLFSSRDHLEMFRQNPERYVPRYGGYCAWAVSRGHTADIEADSWTIHKDRLYLNYSKTIRAKWSTDILRNIRRADENWRWIFDERRTEKQIGSTPLKRNPLT